MHGQQNIKKVDFVPATVFVFLQVSKMSACQEVSPPKFCMILLFASILVTCPAHFRLLNFTVPTQADDL